MTAQELKSALLEEHKRDKRLTFIGLGLITLGIVILVVFAYKYILKIVQNLIDGANSSEGDYVLYYKIVGVVVIGGYILYPFYRWYKLNLRPKKIDEFIDKVEKGFIAQDIGQETVYKIILPLFKIKINLCPVENLIVDLDDNTVVFYKFPIAIQDLPETKVLLSGANKSGVDKAWYEIYDNNTQIETKTDEILKSQEEFNAFVASDLKTDLDDIEGDRKTGKKRYILFGIITAIVLIGFYTVQYLLVSKTIEIEPKYIIIGFFGVFVVFYIVYFLFARPKADGQVGATFNHKFKIKIFEKMVHFINPSFQYILHGHITIAEFIATGLFQEKNYDVSGNDQIIGKHNGVPFQLCDLSADRTRNLSSENAAPDQVFKGQFFIAKFNKSFSSEVYLIPKKAGKNDIKDHLNYFGEKVILEDPEFMKLYTVYSDNQTEARQVLTTALMQRIKDLTIRNKGKYLISFVNNRITVANNNGKNNFELSRFKSITENNTLQDFYSDLCSELSIIDDLKLNINIWKKPQ